MIRPLVATLFAAVLVFGVTGCGDDDEPTTSGDSGTTTTTAGGDTGGPDYGGTSGGSNDDAAEGVIVAADFSLTDITALPGEPISLKNEGEQMHTATADDGGFDLGPVDGGETSEPGTAPTEPGSYAFHCTIHPNMTATLTVEG
jgi:plastocyanin